MADPSIELILEVKIALEMRKKVRTRKPYVFFSNVNFVMPTSRIAFDSIFTIRQFVTARFSNAV